LDAAPVVADFAEDVVACYAARSLALGDYRPAVSDLDLVAVARTELDEQARRRAEAWHRAYVERDGRAARLHCVYVALDQARDVRRPHPTWAHGELFDRPLSGIARAELQRAGVVVLGPAPAEVFSPVDHQALTSAVLDELTGYWADAVHKPQLWLQDVYVDLGLVLLPRAEAAIEEDRLITKAEALQRLWRFDVPQGLAAEIARRRDGHPTSLTTSQRQQRAEEARRLCATGISRLTGVRLEVRAPHTPA
jgi:hypothetical protein